MLFGRALACVGLAGALFACSSESLSGDAGPSGGAGGTGGSGNAGSGGSGSGKLPDYTQSPCYGEPATTEVYDLRTHGVHSIDATCRAEGDTARLYVADDLWQTTIDPASPPLGDAEVGAFMVRYELKGAPASAHPELGVLPTDELVFGSLPDSSLTDGKLPVFVIDSNGAGDGYLCSWCDKPALHLDAPALGSLHTDNTLSIAAHESYHAIHRAYDPNEEVWVNETIAEAAMTVNGFYTDQAWVSGFLQNTNQMWGPGVADAPSFNYGAGLLFGTYLWERGGAELLYAITHDPGHGWVGITDALASVGDPLTGFEVFQEMALAIFLNDPANGHGFRSIKLPGSPLPYLATTGTPVSETVAPYGLMFVTFDQDATSVEITTQDTVSAQIVLAGAPDRVESVPANQPFDFTNKTPRVLVVTAQAAADVSILARD